MVKRVRDFGVRKIGRQIRTSKLGIKVEPAKSTLYVCKCDHEHYHDLINHNSRAVGAEDGT